MESPVRRSFLSAADGGDLVWRDQDGRPDASRCCECGQPSTVALGGPMLGPVTFVFDRHAGILRPLVEASLSRLDRGRPWPRPNGVVRLNLDLVAC